MYYVFVGLIGAFITISISLASRSNFYLLAGLIPFFPTFSLIAYFMVFKSENADKLDSVIQFNIISMLPFLTFAISMSILHHHFGFYASVACSIAVWLVSAALTYIIYNAYFSP